MAIKGATFAQATIHGGIKKSALSISTTVKKTIPSISTISAAAAAGIIKAGSITSAKATAKLTTQKVVKSTPKKTTTTVTKKTTTTTQKKTTTTTKATTTKSEANADIVKWSGNGGISFFVKPTSIKGVKDISIKASADTEDKENGGEKYTVKKNAGGLEITMTAILNAALGVNVESAAKSILNAARKADNGYFYIAGKKLFTAKFMMTDAEAQNVILTGDGTWVSCEVNMTLKQCSKYDGTTSSPAPAPSTPSTSTSTSKPSTTTTTQQPTLFQKVAEGVKTAVNKVTTTVKTVISNIASALKNTNTAKQQSQSVLKDSNRSGGGGGVSRGGGGKCVVMAK